MRRRLGLATAIAIVMIALAVPIAAQAGFLQHWSGESAYASFDSQSGDVRTTVWLEAQKGKQQSPPGNGQAFSRVYLWIYSWDVPSGDVLFRGWGMDDLGPKDFTVGNGLKTASLNADITVTQWIYPGPVPASFTVGVDADWLGNGKAARSKSIYHFIYDGERFMDSESSVQKSASATGAFTVGGMGTINLSTENAMLASGKQRTTAVY